MFGFLAAPLISNMLGNALGNLFKQGGHGCHGHRHHHDRGNLREAAQDFRMAREDFREAQKDFARGDFIGGMQELADANQHMQDGYSHLSGGRGWI